MASHHSHAPWRKSILIPFWTLQLGFELLMIGLLAVAIGVLVYWQHNDEEVDSDSPIYSDVNSGAVHAAKDV
jgi:hypothetical protein